ncbi:MAG TPA: family 43 glycosylhydrolase [Sedimentisphaerales bacterium]|nr:family 43 glycosylhydrolase [Sedimentisphaerales bacterium]
MLSKPTILHTALIVAALVATQLAAGPEWAVHYSSAEGIGPEEGVMRRDPSDIIRVGNLYYVWYSKGKVAHGYDATVWYATSNDGHTWTEKGEALARGPQGSWDEQSVFTPNILVAEGKYWLYYTAVPKPFFNSGPNITKTAIGIAVADAPDGPWKRLTANPILRASDDPNDFDSMRVDDACLLVRDGKYWLYYKGRQWNNTPVNTKMGLAIADRPEGPYVKHKGNPLISGGHEVLVWPLGGGVAAMVSIGPKGIAKTLQYAPDGLTFSKLQDLKTVPSAPGAYRPEAFSGSRNGKMPEWGIHIGSKKGFLPFLARFDLGDNSLP